MADENQEPTTTEEQLVTEEPMVSEEPAVSEEQTEENPATEEAAPIEEAVVSEETPVSEETAAPEETETTEDQKPVEETITEQEPAPEPCEQEEDEDDDVEYICPSEFNEREEMRKMFVGGIDKDTTDEEFKGLFSVYGDITDFIIIRKETNKSDRLFGFITYANCDSLDECLLNRPHKYKERDLDCKRAVPRNQDDGHHKVKKLHIANVPTEFNERDLKRYLLSRHPLKFGKIEEINLLKAKDEHGNPTDKNRGFGFVTVSNEDFADRIAIGESKFTLNGHSMRMSKAKPRNNEGGDRGGRKGGRNQGANYGGSQGGWEDWSGYGGGYGGGYGYGAGYGYNPYGYGGGYDYYGGYANYGPQRTGRGGGRFQPY